jgi:serine protease Do
LRWLVVSLALLAPAAAAQAPDFAALVRREAPSVVSLSAAYSIPAVLPDVPHDEMFPEFLDRLAWMLAPDFEDQSLGSGFLIDAEGYVLTNFHVLDEATNDEVVVRLADGRELLGRVAGADPDTDLALVKIEPAGLPPVRVGDPKALQPGEWVATIGSPFGFERSVAAGIVSATGRSIPVAPHIPFIQTDVAMNPGHSGAPLFNARGEVVGVNSLIFSNTGGSIGVSFAIPIDLALQVAEALRRHGRVTRGRIGVSLQEVTAELARALRLAAPAGALVTQVEKGEPAERAGIRAGDVIVRFAGRRVDTHAGLIGLIAAAAPGSAAALELLRDGKRLQLSVRVAGSAYSPARPRDLGGTDRLGLLLGPLPEPQRRRLALERGLLVHRAEGAARLGGIVPGDVLLSLDGAGLTSLDAFRAALERAAPGDSLLLLVARAGARAFVPLRMPAD